MTTSVPRKTTQIFGAAIWQSILDRALVSFPSNELAQHALPTKPERRVRDAIAASLLVQTGQLVETEWPASPGLVDIVVPKDSTPTVWVELKTGYTFDAACSGGAILLDGKYGRGNSVASDVAKLQRAAYGEAYVLYSAVHPEGPLPDWARGEVVVRDYLDKHRSALRRFGSADHLHVLNDRMCERFGQSGEVGSYRSETGHFPITHVLTHRAVIGSALQVQVSLHTWAWRVPLLKEVRDR